MFDPLHIGKLPTLDWLRAVWTAPFGMHGVGLGALRAGLLSLGAAGAVAAGFHLWRIGQAEDRQKRLDSILGGLVAVERQAPAARTGLLQRLGGLIAKTPIVGSGAQAKHLDALASAGFKGSASLTNFLAVKLAIAIGVGFLVWATFEWGPMFADLGPLQWPGSFIAGLAGWTLPDMGIGRLAARRRRRIEDAIPDAIDLLVICAGAGLSLSQAIEEIARDLKSLSPEVADEFETTAAEMRVLPDRGAALENLGKRTGITALRSLIATLNQSVKFGTPLSESLRVFAAEMRTARIARLEERAARLPVLLTLPLIGMIMPSLLMLIATPVGIQIIDKVSAAFPQIFQH